VYTLTVNAAAHARLLVGVTEGADPPQILLAEVGDTQYAQYGAGATCAARPLSAAANRIPEIAKSLPALVGAQPGGHGSNMQGARQYRFDERGLTAPGVTRAAGEVWVATQGGFVVRYTARIDGDEKYFGRGRAGSETRTYVLTDYRTAPDVTLPRECRPPAQVAVAMTPSPTAESAAPPTPTPEETATPELTATPAPPAPTPTRSAPPVVAVSASCQTNGMQIAAPANEATIRAQVHVQGTAATANQKYFKIEYLPPGGGWTFLTQRKTPVTNGELFMWDTSTVPNGRYGIRIIAVDQSGNYPEPCEVWWTVQN
jgi:hypothetical protein